MLRKTKSAIAHALTLWRQRDPSAATYRELLRIVNQREPDTVGRDISKYIRENIVPSM